MGVTAHWLDKTNLSRKSAALACRRMEGRHTYDVIAKELVKIIQDFKIQKKASNAVTDSGSNFVKSFRVYAGVLEPADEEDSDEDSDDEDEDDESESELEDGEEELCPTEIFPLLEEGTDARLPPHMKCCVHRLNNIACKDVDEALEDPTYKKQSRTSMRKARALFKKQKMSTLAADYIREHCEGLLCVIPNKTR